jgi:hypothetical protein
VGLLIQRLNEESKNGEEPVNLRDWLNFLSFDVIGNLGFGSDFNGLKNSKYHPWVRVITKNIKVLFLASFDVLGTSKRRAYSLLSSLANTGSEFRRALGKRHTAHYSRLRKHLNSLDFHYLPTCR